MLTNASRSNELSKPCSIWFCAILGQSSIDTIRNSIQLPDLLNLLFAMIQNASEGQLKTMLYQNYASIVNKTELFHEIASDFNNHLKVLSGDILFLLWNLKAAMLACRDLAYEHIIEMIINQDNLSADLGSKLVKNIEILYETSETEQHFASDAKLFPKRSLLYGQQSFHLICQPFHQLATDDSNHTIVKEISMELYLKLIGSYPKQVIDLYKDEIVITVSQWFTELANMPDKLSLRLEALKAICSLHSADSHLANHVDTIVENIVTISGSLSSLNIKDRLFLAKLVGWFVCSFPGYDGAKCDPFFKGLLNKLLNDKKRAVRVEAAKSKMTIFIK